MKKLFYILATFCGVVLFAQSGSVWEWDFESDEDGWKKSSVAGDASRAFHDTERSFTGKGSFRVEKENPAGYFELVSPDSFPLEPGQSYVATMRYRLESIGDASIGVGFLGKDDAGKQVFQPMFFGSPAKDIRHFFQGLGQLPSPVWREFRMTLRPQRSKLNLHLYIYGGDGTFRCNIDSIQIRPADAPADAVVFRPDFKRLNSSSSDALAGVDMKLVNARAECTADGMKLQFAEGGGQLLWETDRFLPELEVSLDLAGRFPKGAAWQLEAFDAGGRQLAAWRQMADGQNTFHLTTPARSRRMVLTLNSPEGTAELSEWKLRKDFTIDVESAVYRNQWQCGAVNDGVGRGDGFYRKSVTLSAPPQEATIRFFGHNWARLWVNGQNCGTGTEFGPGVSDLTSVLHEGENCLGFELHNSSGGSKVMFEAYIRTADGREMFLYSDETLRRSAVVSGHDWCKPGFDDSGWNFSVPAEGSARDFGNGETAAVANSPDDRLYIGPRQIIRVKDFRHETSLPCDGVLHLRLEGSFPEAISGGRMLFVRDGKPFRMTLEPDEIKGRAGGLDVTFAPRFLPYGKYALTLELDRCRFEGRGIQLPLGECEIVPGGEIPRPRAEVRMHLGHPRLFIDGQIRPAAIFCHGRPYSREVGIMAREAGIKIHQLQVNIKATKPYTGNGDWIGDGTGPSDLGDTERIVFDAVAQLRRVPDGYVMLQIACQPPASFANDPAMQDDLLVTAKGYKLRHGAAGAAGKFGKEYHDLTDMPKGDFSSVSSASEAKRRAYEKLVRDVVRYFEQSPMSAKIIGYGVSGEMDEQWFTYAPYGGPVARLGMGDYSPVMLAEFRRYLAETYGSDEALRKAWGEPNATIAEATIPPLQERDGSQFFVRRPAADFYRALSRSEFEVPRRLLHAIKEESGRRALTWMYPKDSYSAIGYLHYGFHTLGTVDSITQYRDPDTDMFGNPGDYSYRANGRPTSNIGAPGSARINGKIWGPEMDLRTYLIGAYSTSYNPDSLMLTQAHWAKELVSSLKYGASYRVYAFWPGWYNNAGVREGMKNLADLEAYLLERPVRWKPEVCILSDSTGIANVGDFAVGRLHFFFGGLSGLNAHELSRSGAERDVYYLQDILRDDFPAEQYKVVIIADAFQVSDELREAIKTKFSRPGTFILWRWGAGYLNEQGVVDAQAVEKLTGFHVRPYRTDMLLPQVVAVQGSSPLVEGMSVFGGRYRYNSTPVLPYFTLDDTDAHVLARFESGEDVLGVKEIGGVTHIYAALSALPADFFRNLYQQAGVHTYVDNTWDFVSTDGNFVAVHSGVGGQKRVRFPETVRRVRDWRSGSTVAENTAVLDCELRPGDTAIFVLDPFE